LRLPHAATNRRDIPRRHDTCGPNLHPHQPPTKSPNEKRPPGGGLFYVALCVGARPPGQAWIERGAGRCGAARPRLLRRLLLVTIPATALLALVSRHLRPLTLFSTGHRYLESQKREA